MVVEDEHTKVRKSTIGDTNLQNCQRLRRNHTQLIQKRDGEKLKELKAEQTTLPPLVPVAELEAGLKKPLKASFRNRRFGPSPNGEQASPRSGLPLSGLPALQGLNASAPAAMTMNPAEPVSTNDSVSWQQVSKGISDGTLACTAPPDLPGMLKRITDQDIGPNDFTNDSDVLPFMRSVGRSDFHFLDGFFGRSGAANWTPARYSPARRATLNFYSCQSPLGERRPRRARRSRSPSKRSCFEDGGSVSPSSSMSPTNSPRPPKVVRLDENVDEDHIASNHSILRVPDQAVSQASPKPEKAAKKQPSLTRQLANSNCSVTRQREACESLRILVFGAVGNENLKPTERGKVFEQSRGTMEEVRKFVEVWLTLDEDCSGDIDFSEFLEFFAKSKADRLMCMRCVKYLLGSKGASTRLSVDGDIVNRKASLAKCTREDMMRLIWLKAKEDDIRLMNQMFDLHKIKSVRVKTPPLLPKKKRRELLENFNFVDKRGRGLITYTDLVDGGLVEEQMMNEMMLKHDRGTNGVIDQDHFLEMLCPFGFRAHQRVKVMQNKDDKTIRFVYIDTDRKSVV